MTRTRVGLHHFLEGSRLGFENVLVFQKRVHVHVHVYNIVFKKTAGSLHMQCIKGCMGI